LKTIPLLEPLATELELVEQKLHEPVHPEYPQLTAVLGHLLQSDSQRLRPALALLAGRFFSADLGKLVSLAASVEMLHTATLVHDDLADRARLRQGNPASNGGGSQGATVLSGDYLFARAAALAAETDNVRVMAIFARTLMAICNGELYQILAPWNLSGVDGDRAWETALAWYDRRIHAQTASLFAAAAESAAVLGNAPVEQEVALRDYALALGMGFQIVDDVLDFEDDPEVPGRPAGSDLREGIVTLPVLNFLRERPDDDRVAAILRGDSTDDLVRAVVTAVRESPAIEQALDRARGFVAESQAALSVLPSGKNRSALSALAEYTVSRGK